MRQTLLEVHISIRQRRTTVIREPGIWTIMTYDCRLYPSILRGLTAWAYLLSKFFDSLITRVPFGYQLLSKHVFEF